MFDKIKNIKLKWEDGDVVFTMSPIKIKHLDSLESIKYANDEGDDYRIQQICLELIEDTINIGLDEIPQLALQELIDIFIEFNFDGVTNGKVQRKSKEQNENILKCIDFLISEGHQYHDILNYSIFEFSKFVELATDRKDGYKKKEKNDPMKMLKKIGVKVDG